MRRAGGAGGRIQQYVFKVYSSDGGRRAQEAVREHDKALADVLGAQGALEEGDGGELCGGDAADKDKQGEVRGAARRADGDGGGVCGAVPDALVGGVAAVLGGEERLEAGERGRAGDDEGLLGGVVLEGDGAVVEGLQDAHGEGDDAAEREGGLAGVERVDGAVELRAEVVPGGEGLEVLDGGARGEDGLAEEEPVRGEALELGQHLDAEGVEDLCFEREELAVADTVLGQREEAAQAQHDVLRGAGVHEVQDALAAGAVVEVVHAEVLLGLDQLLEDGAVVDVLHYLARDARVQLEQLLALLQVAEPADEALDLADGLHLVSRVVLALQLLGPGVELCPDGPEVDILELIPHAVLFVVEVHCSLVLRVLQHVAYTQVL